MKSKRIIQLFTTLALLAISFTQVGMSETGDIHTLVTLKLSNYPQQMKLLQAQDFDIAGVNYRKKQVTIVASPSDVEKIKALNIPMLEMKSVAGMKKPDADFKTPDEVATLLSKFASQYPNLAMVKSVGKSVEGRDIYAIKITKDVSKDDAAKPVIFFNGMHHAREVMSVEVPLDTIETLLTGYGQDASITRWLDQNVVWVLPMLNVDGNNKVWNSNAMWRKNTRDGYGVDINRNYPYQWGSCGGSSGNTMSDTYRGKSAGSEPESNVLMDLVKQIKPVISVSYHSYSELVLYPYGCKGQYTETREVVEGIGKELANRIVGDNGEKYTPGTSPDILYSVDGGDIDWLYHEAQVIPYVVELNSDSQGFQPSYSKWRESTVKRLRPGWQYLFSRLEGSSLYGQVKDEQGNPVKNAILKIVRTSGGAPFSQRFVAKDTGFFTVIVPSGQFSVTFEAPGMSAQSQSISVGNARVTVNAALKRK